MLKINKHIEIVRSSVSRLNSLTQVSSDAILAVLKKNYTRVGVSIVNTPSDLEALVAKKPDLVFVGMNFVPLEPAKDITVSAKLWLSDYLDEHGIAYTGSDKLAHFLEVNKPMAKQRVQEAGLKTAKYFLAELNSPLEKASFPLAYPVFIKPNSRGGGTGIDSASVAVNFTELQAKVDSIAKRLNSDSLVETYLPGREFSVAILKNETTAKLWVLPIELIATR